MRHDSNASFAWGPQDGNLSVRQSPTFSSDLVQAKLGLDQLHFWQVACPAGSQYSSSIKWVRLTQLHGKKSELSELERLLVHSFPSTDASYWNLNGTGESPLKRAIEIRDIIFLMMTILAGSHRAKQYFP